MNSEKVQLGKSYDPIPIEDKWYGKWIEEGLFKADKVPKPAFSMVPPNVTGSLHVGHARDNTLQDILCRTKRMQGYGAMASRYRPCRHSHSECRGTLSCRKGITRHDLPDAKNLLKVWEWKEQYGTIINQQKTGRIM